MADATFGSVAKELAEMPEVAVKVGRGRGARVLDGAAASAQQRAVALWRPYGRGMKGSAGTIRARMAADKSDLAGYLLVSGVGGMMQEIGTGLHPPQPVLAPAAAEAAAAFQEAVADAGGKLP